MRISTVGAYERGLRMMQQLQVALDHTQQQVASGRRLLTPADDPIASSRSLHLRESLARLEQFERNGDMARNRLNYEESALDSVNNVLQRVRELALQANNATQSNETRQLIAIEMRQRLDELVDLANQLDGNGRYLFAGNSDGTTPVDRQGMLFTYQGDQGQRRIQIGETRRIPDGDAGSDVFFRIRNGNGTFFGEAAAGNTGTGVIGASSVVDPTLYDQDQYTVQFIDPSNYEVLDSSAAVVASGSFQSGDVIGFRGIQFTLEGQPAAGDQFVFSQSRFQNMFESIDRLVTAVEQTAFDDLTRAELANGINSGLHDIDQAIGNVLNVRTEVGTRLAAIDSQNDLNADNVLTVQQTLSEIEDLDYAEALSRLSLQVTTLEAAQQTFIRTRSLSLFNLF